MIYNVSDLPNGKQLSTILPEFFCLSGGVQVIADKCLSAGYSIKKIEDGKIKIEHSTVPDLMLALGALICEDIKEAENIVAPIEFRGLMLDCSRNAVPKLEYLKESLSRLALMGLSHFCLYTEDTYEVIGEPLVGYGRGKYTKIELKEIVDFCEGIGITMFPCIQTLGHLEQVLKYGKYYKHRDTDRVLNACDEKTYEFVDKIISEAIGPYKSDLIHLGMDECWGIGRGNAFKENTPIKPLEIYAKHVARVAEICRTKGLKPIIWGDFVIGMSGEKEMDESEASIIPKHVIMNYWNYYHSDKQKYLDEINKYKKLDYDPIVSPGLQTWGRFWINHGMVQKTVKPCMDAVHELGIKRVLMTMWGDDGHENLFEGDYHSLAYFLSFCLNSSPTDEFWKLRAAKICSVPVAKFAKFSELDVLDKLPGLKNGYFKPTSKMLFYDDPLYGIINRMFSNDKVSDIFLKISKFYKNAGNSSVRHADIFRLASLYSSIIALKFRICMDSRNAYESKKKMALKTQMKELSRLEDKIKKFHKLYRKLWLRERKPFGLEVMDQRFGGMIIRVKCMRETLKKYVDGKITTIPEYELEDPEGI
ncbi:MAG: family 20 glycosylhydrolase, partial [Victivallales bacterium]